MLRQGLDEAAVLGEHAGVVHADAMADEPLQRRPEALGEAKTLELRGDRLLLLLGAHVDRHQRLGPLEGRRLGEVHDVDRRLLGQQQVLDRLVHRGQDPLVGQRDRPRGVRDDGGVAARAAGQVLLEEGRVAERRAHQQELRLGQGQQRHLPRPAALWLAVEVELVHHDLTDVGPIPLAQSDVGEHLGRAADDRGVRVDRRVTGHHADVLGAEGVAQGEELLAHQGLDRRCVVGAHALGQGHEVSAQRHHGLPRPRRRRQDDVGPRRQLQQCLVLRGVQLDPPLQRPVDEGRVDRVRVVGVGGAVGRGREQVGERHRGPIVPDRTGATPTRERPGIRPAQHDHRAWRGAEQAARPRTIRPRLRSHRPRPGSPR